MLSGVDNAQDLDAVTAAIEDFNRFYIRLPTTRRLSFTTLSVLDTLAHGGPMRLTDLTRTEQMTQPGLTQLVTRLERDGLVERRPDPNDRRVALIHITEAGQETGRARHEDRKRQLTPLLARLTEEDRRALASALPVLTRIAELGRERSSEI
jgi:DNA-binding MarR family transcriptional regulator